MDVRGWAAAATLSALASSCGPPRVGDACRGTEPPRCDGVSVLLTCTQEKWASSVCYQGAGCVTKGSVGACDAPPADPVPAVADAGTHPVSDVYPAPHPPLPTVVNAGGPVLQHPRVVPITFTSDDAGIGRGIDAFCGGLGTTAYWRAVSQEYGVGTLSCAPPVHLTRPAPDQTSSTDVEQLLVDLLDGGAPGVEALSPDTVYVFAFPRGTNIVDGLQRSCQDFDGYHANTLGTTPAIPFIVIPNCPPTDLVPLDRMTAALSHELIEAATDPFPWGQRAFWRADDGNAAWTLYTFGEVTDLCEFESSAYFQPAGFPYRVSRSWSNAAAARGHNPCVPADPSTVYFAAVVDQPDTVSFVHYWRDGSGKGIQIPVGGTRTVQVHLFSEAPTGDWNVYAAEATSGTLDLSLDRSVGNNGDSLNLTITVRATDPQYNAEVFVLVSSSPDGSEVHSTFGLVGQ